jgi:tetratricopeptide (TPR) repeat protein
MKKVVFIIVILLVLLGAFFLFKKNIIAPVGNNDIEQVPVPEQSVPEDDKPIVQNTKDTTTIAFNIAMSKAQTLFGKADYNGSINAYNEALKIKKSEYAYSGKYLAELAANKFTDAEKTILLAIGQNNKSSDYWNWYLTLIQEKLGSSKTKLSTVYNQAFESVVSEKKINIVTHYAQILAKIGDKQGAIDQWKKAIEIYPQNKDIYQLEITNLEK